MPKYQVLIEMLCIEIDTCIYHVLKCHILIVCHEMSFPKHHVPKFHVIKCHFL